MFKLGFSLLFLLTTLPTYSMKINTPGENLFKRCEASYFYCYINSVKTRIPKSECFDFEACGGGTTTFIKQGANVNAERVRGETPLLVACRNQLFGIVRVLIDNGAIITSDLINNIKRISPKSPGIWRLLKRKFAEQQKAIKEADDQLKQRTTNFVPQSQIDQHERINDLVNIEKLKINNLAIKFFDNSLTVPLLLIASNSKNKRFKKKLEIITIKEKIRMLSERLRKLEN